MISLSVSNAVVSLARLHVRLNAHSMLFENRGNMLVMDILNLVMIALFLALAAPLTSMNTIRRENW